MRIDFEITYRGETVNLDETASQMVVSFTIYDGNFPNGGSGAVSSVNGKTGAVVLNASDIAETSNLKWLTATLKGYYDSAHTWVNTYGAGVLQSITDLWTALGNKVDKVNGKGLSTNDLTDLLKTAYDGAVSDISTLTTALGLKADKISVISLVAKIPTTYTVIGTTSETQFTFLKIPAGTYTTGDRVILDAMFLKTGGAGTTISSFRISTSNSVSPITNATLIAKTPTAIAATTIYPLLRNYIKIDSPTSTIMQPASNGVYNDLTSTNSLAITNLNIDWTVDQYIYPTETLGNSADAVTLKYFAIYKG